MILIIDGIGANTSSVCFALDRLGKNYELSNDPQLIQRASHVILPGVRSAAHGMKRLQSYNLIEVIKNLSIPVLGICLGMQLLFSWSEEDDTHLLNLLDGKMERFSEKDNLIIPHMGWNQIKGLKFKNPLLASIKDGEYFYFVHSYRAAMGNYTLASCIYGDEFSSIVQRDNFYGVQFHPERSGRAGEILLNNFLNL